MKRIDTKLNYFAGALSRFHVSVFAEKSSFYVAESDFA